MKGRSGMNMYKNARNAAGYTQEKWAEALGLSVDAIRRYENGERLPDDDTAAMMAAMSSIPVLAIWHIRHKSELAASELPEVERVSLPQAVIRLLLAIKEIEPDVDTLLEFARDGVIDEGEADVFREIVRDLQELIAAAMTVKYAEGAETVTNEERGSGLPHQ